MKKRIEAFFQANPIAKAVYVTSDNFLFEDKSLAAKHGQTLEKKEVKTYSPTAEEVLQENPDKLTGKEQ